MIVAFLGWMSCSVAWTCCLMAASPLPVHPRSCLGPYELHAWSLTFSYVSKQAVIALGLVNYTPSLVVFWCSVDRLLEDLTECLAWFKGRTNVESLKHTTNPIKCTFHIWYNGNVLRTFLHTSSLRVDCAGLFVNGCLDIHLLLDLSS